jgi:hypothetical protein
MFSNIEEQIPDFFLTRTKILVSKFWWLDVLLTSIENFRGMSQEIRRKKSLEKCLLAPKAPLKI